MMTLIIIIKILYIVLHNLFTNCLFDKTLNIIVDKLMNHFFIFHFSKMSLYNAWWFSSIWDLYLISCDNIFIIIKKHVRFVFINQFICFAFIKKRSYVNQCVTFTFLNLQIINEWLNFNKNFYEIDFFFVNH